MKTVAVFLPVVIAVAVFLCDVDARRGRGQGRAKGRGGGLASRRGGPLERGRGGGGPGSPESTAVGSRPPTAGDGSSKDRGPTAVRGKDRGSTAVRGKDRGPTAVRGKDRGSTAVRGKDSRPTAVRGKDSGPTAVRGKDSGPTAVRGKDRGPTAVRGKDRGPTAVRGNDGAEPSGKRRPGSMSRDAAGVALSSRLPGLPLDPADGQVSVAAWQRRVDDEDVGQVGVAVESEELGDRLAVSTYGPGLAAVGLRAAATLYHFPDATHIVVVTRTRGACYLIPTPDGLNFASAAAAIASRNGTTVTAAVTKVQLNASGGGLGAELRHNLTASNPSLATFCAFLPIYNTSHADPLTFPAPGEEAEGEVVTSVVTLDSKVSIVGKNPRRPRHGKKKTKRKSKKEAGR